MVVMSFAGMACGRPAVDAQAVPAPAVDLVAAEGDGPRHAVLAGGCFWCTEAVFEQLEGVAGVVSGYAGGEKHDADYRAVSSGTTDHAEVIRVTYDPAKITYGQLLKVFFTVAHDPTQLDRQGPDTGRQYRSAVFYENDEQRRVAEGYIQQLDESGLFSGKIVTTLEPLVRFYEAEAYHQDYVRLNPMDPYVLQQAQPKVQKVKQHFVDQVKPGG